MWKEVVGIISTLFIIVSMCFNSISYKGNLLMRITNIVGSIGFVVYGFVLPAYSTGILNAVLVVVNTYHLIRIVREHKNELKSQPEENKPEENKPNND